MPVEGIDPGNPRWALVARLHETIMQRWPAEVRAVGVCGSLAHADDNDASDVNVFVVAYREGSGLRTARRRVDGILVDLRVATGEESLRRAREISPDWPLEAGRWLTTRALHDPRDVLGELREAHRARISQARPAEFTGLARHNWEVAAAAHARAVRLAEWYETDAAMVVMAQARLHAALVAGLLGRTHFRHAADAVRRTGLAGADMTELGSVLKSQADELTARGRPVDGPLTALFD